MPINAIAIHSTCPIRCWNMSTKNPVDIAIEPAASERTPSSMKVWKGGNPKASWISVSSTKNPRA